MSEGGAMSHPVHCWVTGCKGEGVHEVKEVYFDLGEPVMRLYSTEDYLPPYPRMCDTHKETHAHLLAMEVLTQKHRLVIPRRWHVKYSDGTVVTGEISQTR